MDDRLVSTDVLPNNLPAQLTSFVGRAHELRDLIRALDSTRLLTLTGAGGCGKTRLAAQTGAHALAAFADGAWWIELAPLTDVEAVGPALAEVIGVRPLPGQTSLAATVAHLAQREALLVLDNCEHLLDACREVAEAVLRGCPAVTVLATSRATLGIAGETTWRVPSLSLPPERSDERVDAVAQSDAVRLFIDRARQARPNFSVDEANAPAIAQICHDLDGIPLAIELAAARVRMMAPEQIAAGLDESFRLLTGGARSALPRQQTLRASVDWSHELLDERERMLFRRLAVFAGGWTLDAVEQICAGEGLERLEILDLLTSLVDKSLVLVEEPGIGSMRYRLLETVRQYAFERLLETDEQAGLCDRHRDAYLTRAEQMELPLEATAQSEWLDAVDRESANFMRALDHAAGSDAQAALRMCVALTSWWKLRGRFAQADAAFARALESAAAAGPEDHATLRARVLWARGYLLAYAARFKEAAASEMQALELARALGDVSTAARALDVLGTMQMYPDPVGARPVIEESIELASTSEDAFCVVDATQILAATFLMQSDERAETVFEQAFELIEQHGFGECGAWHRWGIGVVRELQGRDEEALALYEQAIEMADAIGEPVSSGMAHGYRAILLSERGKGERVLEQLEPVMERSVKMGAGLAIPVLRMARAFALASSQRLAESRGELVDHIDAGADEGLYGMAWALTTLARVELALQRPEAAAEHARTVAEIADGKLQSPQFSAAARQIFAEAALRSGEAGEAERLAHEALETALEHLCRPALAPLLDLLARCAAALDSFRESARILGAVERSRADSGRVRWAHEQDAIAALDLLLREGLGEKSHLEAWSEGSDMSVEEAIAWLRRSRGSRKRPAAGWDSLTPTELQVVEFASRGFTNPEIGERMFISRGTVKVHLSHIYAKLDVRNRSQLAALATRRPA